MDINSYKSRVDVQVRPSDTIPSDSIRINRFYIDWDEDGQPYEAFATQQQDHLSQYDKGDYAEEPSRHRKIYKAGTVQNKIKQSKTIGENKMNKPTKTNEVKIKGNPLIQRTLRNLKNSSDLKPSKIIVECDMAKPAISIRKKQVIQVCDQNGNVTNTIDRNTDPQLYDKLCGMTSDNTHEQTVQHPKEFKVFNIDDMKSSKMDADQYQYNKAHKECYECDEEDDEEDIGFNMPAGFGVTPMRAINQVSFKRGGMFENLQQVVTDVSKILTQNAQSIEDIKQQKKFIKERKKLLNNKK